jgi:hypothetical protein
LWRRDIVAQGPRLWPNTSFVAAKATGACWPIHRLSPDPFSTLARVFRAPLARSRASSTRNGTGTVQTRSLERSWLMSAFTRVFGALWPGQVACWQAKQPRAPFTKHMGDAERGNHAARYAGNPGKRPYIAIVTRAPQTVFLSSLARLEVAAARDSRSCGGLHANIYAVNCNME